MSHDLSKLYVKFHEANPDIKLVEQFSELAAFPEFRNAMDDNEIKIAILMGDIDSPFIRIKHRETMLNAIFDYLNIPLSENKQKKFFKEILTYRHNRVIGCWVRYIQVLHDIDWTDWLMAQQTYNFLLDEAQKPQETDEDTNKYVKRRVDMQTSLKKIGLDMKAIESKLFPDSKAAREASLYENKKIFTYAEKYAEENTYI